MNRDDVIDVLTAVAAADKRTVGDADVNVWQEIIGGLHRQDALRAVRDHLRDQPGVWIEPGHVYQRVRSFVRDQIEREPRAAREARQEALAAKAAEDFEALAERKGLPGPVKFQRGARPEVLVACPFCKAKVGEPCGVNDPSGRREPLRKSRAHHSRLVAAGLAMPDE